METFCQFDTKNYLFDGKEKANHKDLIKKNQQRPPKLDNVLDNSDGAYKLYLFEGSMNTSKDI